MIAVLLTVHSLVVLALIGVVLLQRSEGGALGIGGGGGGMGGFMTGRGAANVLTRTTSVLAFLFFSTSLLLGIFHSRGESDDAVLRELTSPSTAPATQTAPAAPTTDDLLQSLGTGSAQPSGDPAPEAAPTDETLLGAEPPPAADTPADDPEPQPQPNR